MPSTQFSTATPPSTADSFTITPYASESVRLLRETWANPTMLAEEIFAILQRGIPIPRNAPVNINVNYGSISPALTLEQNGDGPIVTFRNQDGQTMTLDQNFNFTVNSDGPVAPTDAGGSANRIAPLIDWSDPANMVDGDTLGDTQLNAVARDPRTRSVVTGSFVYTPPSGTTMNTGADQALGVVFTPDNQRTYQRNRKTVHVTVLAGKITPTITPVSPNLFSNITLLEAGVSAVGKNGVDTVAGTMAYDPDRGTTPAEGPLDIKYTFTPTDTSLYNTPSPLTVSYTVSLGFLSGNGIVTDASDPHAVVVGSVMVSRSGQPSEGHADVTADKDPSADTPGNGAEVGVYYDYGSSGWFYTFGGS